MKDPRSPWKLLIIDLFTIATTKTFQASSTVACPWFHVELNTCEKNGEKKGQDIVDGKKHMMFASNAKEWIPINWMISRWIWGSSSRDFLGIRLGACKVFSDVLVWLFDLFITDVHTVFLFFGVFTRQTLWKMPPSTTKKLSQTDAE